ncbi:fumarate hydratase [Candidatus Bathyarchaeota archaeon]|nr:fumarate hydratase [Candidatus Bathyarchaeota archaeon]
MINLEKIVEDTAVELLKKSVTELPTEFLEELKKILTTTNGAVGQAQLRSMITNSELAKKSECPICQDTGVISYIITLGDDFPIRSNLKKILRTATRRATEKIPLRPNSVDIFKGNTGDNTSEDGNIPIIYLELVSGDKLEIIVMPKGGGSSNVSVHKMIKPGLGIVGVKKFIIEAVADAGSLGCPPYFVGVGVGGSEDLCMLLAKKALLKPFKKRNSNSNIAAIEEELLTKLNQLEIGAMGLGEGPTVLDLHVEFTARHPASLPVGVVISCWALRYAKATISKNGEIIYN